MSSTYGEHLKLSIFGQSHGKAIGMTLDGVPAGLAVDLEALQAFLDRRAPGAKDYTSGRREPDCAEFLSGLVRGHTCGAPICAIIANEDHRSADYEQPILRPGHADLTAQLKYGGYQDTTGGGHFSGRLTAPLCIAGGLCKQWLEKLGIRIGAHILQIGGVIDSSFDPMHPALDQVSSSFPTLSPAAGEQMLAQIRSVQVRGDSIGGQLECAITGLPAGIGEPMFGGLECRIGQIIYGIPGVKALEFGRGCDCKALYGSQHNDPITMASHGPALASNHCGGILGGISTGTPVLFRVTVKPTPSISLPQETWDPLTGKAGILSVTGRHDPCIATRVVPVVEAAAAIAIYDSILSQSSWRK